METLELLASLAAAGTPCVLATVVSCEAPTSARPGDKAGIAEDGSLTGWIGGGCSEPAVRREALRALADGRPRVLRLTAASAAEEPGQPGRVTQATTCPSGGSLEILIDPQLPRPVLLVFGETPAAETMARLADPSLDVALVASGRRARSVLDGLRERGFDEDALARVRTPAGGTRGASQEEIALAAVAEVVALRRQRRQPAAAPGPARLATDPVCGMAVEGAGSSHVASHRGLDHHFCCSDCRRRFVEDPERFLATARAVG